MKKVKTALAMKGLNTPRLISWLRGYLHGRVLHTGGLDPETGVIASGYVTGQTKRLRGACVARRELAEAKLQDSWTQAEQLLIDYAALGAKQPAGGETAAHNSSAAQARAGEKAAAKRAQCEAQRQEILKKLADIQSAVRMEYDAAHDQMEATAEQLLSVFASYGHGLMTKPVYAHNLPTLAYKDCAQQILTAHEDTLNTVSAILKEVHHALV